MPHVALMLMLSKNCNEETEKMQERLSKDGRYLCLMAVILALETLRLSMLDLKDATNAPLPLSHPIFSICHGNVFSANQAVITIPAIVGLLPSSAIFTLYSLLRPHFSTARGTGKSGCWERASGGGLASDNRFAGLFPSLQLKGRAILSGLRFVEYHKFQVSILEGWLAEQKGYIR